MINQQSHKLNICDQIFFIKSWIWCNVGLWKRAGAVLIQYTLGLGFRDLALFTWNKMFSEVADQHAPVKRRRVKGTPLPWMNSQISDTMKERDWAHRKARKSNSARHWSMYAKLRNKVNGLVRTAKSKYYCDMIEEAKGDSEKVWKAVNEACNRNSSSESIQCIISDGVQHITSQSIASSMNSFFASIIVNGGRLVMKAGDLQRPNSSLCFFLHVTWFWWCTQIFKMATSP